MDAFDLLWQQLAERGWCDSVGSAEYRRVRALWGAGGMTAALSRFIARESNPGTNEGRCEALAMDALYEAGGRANAEVERLKKEREEIIRALRFFVNNSPTSVFDSRKGLNPIAYEDARKQCVELLAVIDAQKPT